MTIQSTLSAGFRRLRRPGRIVALLVAAGVAVCAAGCGSDTQHPRKHFSAVYRDGQGREYTRTYDDSSNAFIYWMLFYNSGPYTYGGSGSSVPSGSSWQQQSSAPSGLRSTGTVVEDNNEPTDTAEQASQAPADETVDENTSASQAQSEDGSSSADASSSDSSSSDGSSSDSSASDGGASDGGGDAGGGDAGGGGGY